MAQVSEFMQTLFNKYKENILTRDYYPKTALETLRARTTATWLLKNNDPSLIVKAEAFIKKTSVSKDDELAFLHHFSEQVKSWNHLEICSIYTNSSGLFVEYKLNVTTASNEEVIVHQHALHQIKEERCYFISQTAPLIRIIGDPVLHKPGIIFPENPTEEEKHEFKKQIDHAAYSGENEHRFWANVNT